MAAGTDSFAAAESAVAQGVAPLIEGVPEGTREGIGSWMQVTAKQWDTIRPYITVAVEAAAVDPELRGLVDQWMDEAIADVEEGLQQAGRFDPETRHLRDVLALAQLDYVARHWEPGHWNIEHDRLVEVLTDNWVHLVSDRTTHEP
jgi:hypothetical protein